LLVHCTYDQRFSNPDGPCCTSCCGKWPLKLAWTTAAAAAAATPIVGVHGGPSARDILSLGIPESVWVAFSIVHHCFGLCCSLSCFALVYVGVLVCVQTLAHLVRSVSYPRAFGEHENTHHNNLQTDRYRCLAEFLGFQKGREWMQRSEAREAVV
jgi:hypothetical protein